MTQASSFSMWLGILALKHKLGDDPDVNIVEACVRSADHKETPELLEAVERIRTKLRGINVNSTNLE